MTQRKNTLQIKTFSPGGSLVEAFTRTENGYDQRMRFPQAHIVRYTEDSEHFSSLYLADGTRVRTTLPLDALCAQIESPDIRLNGGDLIDLKPHTGAAVTKQEEKYMLEAFNVAAPRDGSVTLALYGFTKRTENQAQPFIINTKDITDYQEDRTFDRPDEIGFISASEKGKCCFFFMPIETLQARIREAEAQKIPFINLLEETLPPAIEGRKIIKQPERV